MAFRLVSVGEFHFRRDENMFVLIELNLGRGIGLLISLFIYTRKQKSQLFLFYAVLNLIGVGLYLIYCLIIKFRSKKSAENV